MAIPYIKYGPPTAYGISTPIGTDEYGRIIIRVVRWNCWGEKRGGPGAYYIDHVPAGYKTGMRNYVTLDMMAQGCCPPQLMRDYIMQEGGELEERDPVVEAMKLHKRGYFGGGG